MSLKYAVLGLLHEKPMHGYEMKKIFEMAFSRLWRISPGQLYPTLRKIVTEGLAEKKVIRQEGKPDAHLYRITAKGKSVFADWLATPAASMPLFRYDFMLKLFFYEKLDRERAKEEIELLRKGHQDFIQQLRRMKMEVRDRADEFQLLIIEGGILFARAGMKWLDRVRSAL